MGGFPQILVMGSGNLDLCWGWVMWMVGDAGDGSAGADAGGADADVGSPRLFTSLY